MGQVSGSKKYRDNIQVFWSTAGNENQDFFTYEDLITRKIHALDLLNNPGIDRIDPDGHRIESIV
jgi:hypothetical protein